MGFQGSLDSVNLGDILQTLAMNRQTGTLVVQHDDINRHVWFFQGEIALGDGLAKDGSPNLLAILQRKGLLTPAQIKEVTDRLSRTGQPLRELILASGFVAVPDLDEVCAWALEEMIYEIFEWSAGTFQFIDGDPVQELCIPEIIEMGDIRVQTTQVVMEATRRQDEWQQIRVIIPNDDELYLVDNDGRANLRQIESDPEMLKVLRYLDGKHTILQIAETVGVSKFDAYAIVAQLVDNSIARPRGPQEIVNDALKLRADGQRDQARELLENAARRIDLPEVMRPLAELTMEAGDRPRAVELYLDLIQRAQDDGDLDQALADLDIVIDINPEDPDLLLERAEVLLDLQENDQAADAFVAAAGFLLSNRATEQAIDACHRAKDLAPTKPEPHRLLAKAYLLDGEMDTAVAEYRSLWHTLLTEYRARRALDILKDILTRDCKFPRITDQVLQHAQGSDAVKTGSAVRTLIWVLIVVILLATAYKGYEYYENTHKRNQIQSLVVAFEQSADQAFEAFKEHLIAAESDAGNQALDTALEVEGRSYTIDEAITRLRELRTQTKDDVLVGQIASLIESVQQSQQTQAEQVASLFDSQLAAGNHAAASQALAELERNYVTTDTGSRIPSLREQLEQQRAQALIADDLQAADAQWKGDEWDAAIAALASLIDANRQALPTSVVSELEAKHEDWTNLVSSAAFLRERAESMHRSQRYDAARSTYARAIDAQGERDRDIARQALAALEEELVSSRTAAIGRSIADGDPVHAFRLLDELRDLAEEAYSPQAKDAVNRVQLPLTIVVDSHRTVVSVTIDNQQPTEHRSQSDSTGEWRFDITYRPGETVTINGERTGFSTNSVEVTAQDRRIEVPLSLERGPLWQQDLGGVAVTEPVVANDQFIVIGTDRNTIELVDINLGATRTVPFSQTVASFTTAPFVYQGTAFLPLDGQIHAITLAARTTEWIWPAAIEDTISGLGALGVWVQEHQLNIGQDQLFAGARDARGLGRGRVVVMAIEGNQLIRYPDAPTANPITGAPVVIDEVLYVPAGTELLAYDPVSTTENDPLSLLYSLESRGELIGRPVAATVDRRDVVLVTDSAGVVVAVDANPRVSANQRTVASWLLEGQARQSPTIDAERQAAYVSLNDDGRVVALDCSVAGRGRLRWRFPADGSIGTITGPPAMGQNGLYVADTSGRLYCIDPTDGSQLWRVDLGSGATTGVLAREGRLFVATRSGGLLCFEEGEL